MHLCVYQSKDGWTGRHLPPCLVAAPAKLLFPQVREALVFSAMLRLPGSMSSRAKQARALSVAGLLNLGKSLDSVVGSSLTKGISGWCLALAC